MSGMDVALVLRVGTRASFSVEITEETMNLFAKLSGDTNPLHMDEEVARRQGFPRRVAHGALLMSYLSRLIGVHLPGPGTLWMTQTCSWLEPVFPGDRLNIEGQIAHISSGTGVLTLQCTAHNQLGKKVFEGEGRVLCSRDRLTAATPPRSADESARMDSSPKGIPRITRTGALLPNATPRRRLALVTGGGRGIGASIALELARQGMEVAITYHSDAEAGRAMADRLAGDYQIQSGYFPLDLFREESVKALVPAVVEKMGGAVDVLVNSGGPPLVLVRAEAVNRSQLRRYWEAFVESTMDLVQAVLPGMKERGWGRIINLGTGAMGGTTPAQFTPYLCAKMALLGLTRSLAVELGPLGITVNMVSPGMTVTDFSREISHRIKMAEAQRNPRRRLATPEDSARTVAFLASDAADYVNGVNLFLTGGNPT